MRKIANYLILLLLTVFIYSCTIKLNGSNDNNNNNNNNNPPPTPTNPIPSNGATGVSLTPQLSWTCNDSSYNQDWFDVYLDSTNQLYNSIQTVNSTNYTINSPLVANKTYYWKIKANNNNGQTTSSIWSFTTTSGLPTNGLLAYYPFNGNANDESGNGHTGLVSGANLTWDRFNNTNKAYGFDGVSSKIIIQSSPSLQPTGGITLSAWVMFYDLGNTSSILAKGSDTTAGWYSLSYEPTSQKFYFQINFSNYINGTKTIDSSNTNPQTNIWYSVIGTFSSSSMKLYINGQFENSLYVPNSLGSNTGQLQIGSCAENHFLNGVIDDIRVYNRALSEAEISQVYHEGGWTKKR